MAYVQTETCLVNSKALCILLESFQVSCYRDLLVMHSSCCDEIVQLFLSFRTLLRFHDTRVGYIEGLRYCFVRFLFHLLRSLYAQFCDHREIKEHVYSKSQLHELLPALNSISNHIRFIAKSTALVGQQR